MEVVGIRALVARVGEMRGGGPEVACWKLRLWREQQFGKMTRSRAVWSDRDTIGGAKVSHAGT